MKLDEQMALAMAPRKKGAVVIAVKLNNVWCVYDFEQRLVLVKGGGERKTKRIAKQINNQRKKKRR